MNQKLECIEKHLYLRQYKTAGGQWSTLYYGIFVDWKGTRAPLSIERAYRPGQKLQRDQLNNASR